MLLSLLGQILHLRHVADKTCFYLKYVIVDCVNGSVVNLKHVVVIVYSLFSLVVKLEYVIVKLFTVH